MNTPAASPAPTGSDLAILHADEDATAALCLAEAARRQGLQLAWQPPGTPMGATLSAALNASRVVCVLWSAHSRHQEWVCDRAARALLREALVAVNLDPAPPPPGLGAATPLTLPPGHDADSPVVLAALEAALRRSEAASPTPATAPAPTPAPAASGGLFKLVLGHLRGQPAPVTAPARPLRPAGPMPVDDRFERTIPVPPPGGGKAPAGGTPADEGKPPAAA